MKRPQTVVLVEVASAGAEIIAIRKLGYEVILLSTGMIPLDVSHLEQLSEHIIDKRIVELEILERYLNEIRKRHEVVAFYSPSDFFVYPVAVLCERYGWPTLRASSANLYRQKHQFRQRQQELNYPTPQFHVCASLEEGQALLATSESPWVFKPVNGNESVGVQLVDTTDELAACYKKLKQLSRYSQQLITDTCYLLEEYLPGEVYSCEFLKDQDRVVILGITNRQMSEPPYFIELGYEFPCQDDITEEILNTTHQFIRDFDFDFGPCHIEFIVKEGQVYLLEVNPRLIGFPNYWMINRALQCDILQIVMLLYRDGQIPEFDPVPHQYTVCHEITAPADGYLEQIECTRDWASEDVWVFLNLDCGKYVRKASSNREILVRTLAAAPNVASARQLANEVRDSIHMRIV